MIQENLNSYAKKLYKFQEDNGYFKANPESGKPTFSIMIPPPNVSNPIILLYLIIISCIVIVKACPR